MIKNRKILLFLAVAALLAAPVRSAELPPLPDKPGATVKGYVECEGRGVEGVVVSDGFNVVKTDAEGRYWLKTKLSRSEFVMISTPRGYDPEVYSGFLPKFFHALDKTADKKSVQQFDFHLTRAANDDYTLLVVADEHVSGRVIDIPPGSGNVIAPVDSIQFRDDFMPRLVEYADSLMRRTPVYGLNLGDMTHSEYWFRNNTGMAEYLRLAKDTPFLMYHVIGNHDHCHKYENDYEAEAEYRKYFGPTYYSFNIGKAHFIMLDNTVYLNAGADASTRTPGDHSYNSAFTEMELAWLKADLATVKDKNAPLVIGTHCQVFYYNSSLDITPSMAYGHSTVLDQLLSDFTDVHIISGHTHNNTTMKIRNGLMEHNTGGSCATWWWTGYYSNGHICKDGAPGGMGVYEFRDTDLEWYYKGYGEPRDFQLRTYDMNNVKTFFANNSVIRNMIRYYPDRNDYANVGNNVVYINVWGWDPEWKVSVKENGVELNPTRVYMKDPLHTYAYDATRVYKNSNNTYTEVLTSSNNYHLFAANASSATSTLTIEVTDRFGNKYTETMSRPKEFAAQIENL